MLDITTLVSKELSLSPGAVENALLLRSDGGTIPFIARYRKERTGGLDEVQLRDLFERVDYLTELAQRKEVILKSIEEQGKLTEELKTRLQATLQKTELEDLYLPYKPKKRTRATIAKEKGLQPLSLWLMSHNHPAMPMPDLNLEASRYLSEEKGVTHIADALQGAADIIAEEIAEHADHRSALRTVLFETGEFVSKIKDEFPEGTTKFEMYRDYRAKAKTIPSHNMLALRRGEAEGVLILDLIADEDAILTTLYARIIKSQHPDLIALFQSISRDAYMRLMKATLIGELRYEKKKEADAVAVNAFAENLRELLLSAPAGMKPTLAVDPGFRTGCKVAAISETGKFLEYHTIFPHQSAKEREQAALTLSAMIDAHHIELIAIGNGTAGRETEQVVAELLQARRAAGHSVPIKVMVNESGASIYSAGDAAREEFPDLDLTIRGAISIGRRLQDPLAELVKIEAKSIGVGQYQHDVDQKLLKTKLDETVESCVNFVGVDLNTASKELLTYVSGLNASTAKNIVSYRNEHGAFKSRNDLMNVPKFGPKAFEQAAGFLRIRNATHPLDNTAVHPESYPIVEKIAATIGCGLENLTTVAEEIKKRGIATFVSEEIGEYTLRDVVSELEKPGRDPRAEFTYAQFKEGVSELKDLKPGMELEGVVTNVTDFGAFVDIGVHQDGLVHISQLADRFVKHPHEVVKVGQIITVYVLEVNEPLNRISLSRRKPQPAAPNPAHPSTDKNDARRHTSSKKGKQHPPSGGKPQNGSGSSHRTPEPRFTIDDLKSKFNSK